MKSGVPWWSDPRCRAAHHPSCWKCWWLRVLSLAPLWDALGWCHIPQLGQPQLWSGGWGGRTCLSLEHFRRARVEWLRPPLHDRTVCASLPNLASVIPHRYGPDWAHSPSNICQQISECQTLCPRDRPKTIIFFWACLCLRISGCGSNGCICIFGKTYSWSLFKSS